MAQNRGGAVGARLARGDAQFDQLAHAEQRKARARGEQLAPVEAALRVQQLPLLAAIRALPARTASAASRASSARRRARRTRAQESSPGALRAARCAGSNDWTTGFGGRLGRRGGRDPPQDLLHQSNCISRKICASSSSLASTSVSLKVKSRVSTITCSGRNSLPLPSSTRNRPGSAAGTRAPGRCPTAKG